MSTKLQLTDINIDYEGAQITKLIIDKYGSIENFMEETSIENACSTIKKYLRGRRLESEKVRFALVNIFDKGWDELIKPIRLQLEEYAVQINRNIPAYNSRDDIVIANKLISVCKKEIAYHGEYTSENEDIVKEHIVEAERLRLTLSKLYRAKGMMYFYCCELITAEEFINLAIEEIKGKSTDLGIYYYSDLGVIAIYNSQKDRAINYYETAKICMQCVNRNVDEYILFYFYYCYASALLNIKYYSQAEKSLRECFKYTNESDNIGAVYFKLGLVYKLQGDFDNAIEMYKQSIELINDEIYKAIVNNNIAVICKATGKMEMALDYVNKALNLVRGKSLQYEILCSFTLCEINIMQGDDTALSTLFNLIQDIGSIYIYKENLIKGFEAIIKAIERNRVKLTELRNYLYNMTKTIKLNKSNNEFFSELSKCYVMTLHCLEKLEKRVKP